MEHVNYEERYPTVVTPENTPNYYPDYSRPQTASSAPAYSEKILLDNKKQAEAHVYPEVVRKDVPLKTFYSTAVTAGDEPNAVLPPTESRKYCGMSKKAFLIALGVGAFVVVAVVAGAIGGALASRKSSKTSASAVAPCAGSQCSSSIGSSQIGTAVSGASATGNPGSAASATGSGSASPTSISSVATTLDTTASIGEIAASTVQSSTSAVYVHLYYQQGSNIAYRTYPGKGSYSVAQALPLSVQPKTGTSIAASEFLDANSNYMLVFYQDASNNIICANFTSTLGTNNLTLTKSVQIAAGTTAHPVSSLAAAYLGADAGSWRVYYQGTDGTILELVGLAKGWKAGAILSADALGGSPLSLSMVTAPEMNIFYVDSSTTNLYSISYNDGWQTPSPLTGTAMTKWNGSDTSLAAIQESEPDYLRTYYIGTDSEIHEFYGNPGEAFSPKSDQSPYWDVLDSQGPGAIAGIGWSDQVRLYYVSGGKIVQTALSNATWGSTTSF